ncbi:toxin-antitoxin system HicB family antitoxin [Aeromonas salmonicida]|uniref:toxin-antitoxin system HicB family antitoxin n=1 Tax=Aeromonas salmonicida TaxID=645 RepID=UPI00285AA35F|nr:toxin-antitoxin system HicB family antitoxin [Aeromonas salmonicida]MDR6993457.1 putative HicB family RNase H-like nuclease [Aeromonas salmonicida]
MINPEEYTISVRMESVEGEKMYVAKIQELPDVIEYADTPEYARELALDTIATMYEICQEKGIHFPSPNDVQIPEASGRFTLRLPKSVHAAAIQRAQLEGISLNQYMSNSISSALIKADYLDIAKNALAEIFDKYNEENAKVSKALDIHSRVLNYYQKLSSSKTEVKIIYGQAARDLRLAQAYSRGEASFNNLVFNESKDPDIIQTLQLPLPAEPFKKSKRQSANIAKAGAL